MASCPHSKPSKRLSKPVPWGKYSYRPPPPISTPIKLTRCIGESGDRSTELCNEMVSHFIQLLSSISYPITHLGYPNGLKEWSCIITCHGPCPPQRSCRYWLPPFPPACDSKLTLQDRLKNADFERAMKLVTARIDVRNDDRLMHLVFKEALANGAVEIWWGGFFYGVKVVGLWWEIPFEIGGRSKWHF